MTRKLQYTIQAQAKGKTIDMFLKEKGYSRATIIKLKETKTGIEKNGVWARVIETLETGDILDICLEELAYSKNIIPKDLPLDILYEDEDILVLNKPYDTPIHPTLNNYDNTLANGVMYYYHQQNKPFVFRCLNRLDRDTTGVTILAKNLISSGILSKQMQESGISRIYMAFVQGITKERGIIDLPIGREEGSIIKRMVDETKGKRAVTHYHRQQVFYVEGEPVSVVKLQLETGRTHQIRVHMAAIGHPLVGDFLYNKNNRMLARQGLHAVECGFCHPITGEYLKIVAPLPRDMAALITLVAPTINIMVPNFCILLKFFIFITSWGFSVLAVSWLL